jgi:hypothetical protein
VEDFNSDIPSYLMMKIVLIAEFSEKEIFDAIDQMEKNKAPGLMGSLLIFFKTFGT